MVRKKIKRGQMQVSFAWLFAIIVGAVILFIAIFGATRLGDTGDELEAAETGKEIGILLNPLETGFEEGVTNRLSLPAETRIRNKCLAGGNFGRQGISVAQESFGDFSETDIDVGFSNKYIFSDEFVQGKSFFIFSKPFDFPFKVSDVIYLTSSERDYCFVDSPERIEEEIEKLGQANLFVEDCPGNSVRVCFDGGSGFGSDCDVDVDERQKSVTKGEETVYYETDALMFAAIFSEKNIYECQVKRLLQRAEELALVYNDKVSILSSEGCLPGINLLALGDSVNVVRDSSELVSVSGLVKSVERENSVSQCQLW